MIDLWAMLLFLAVVLLTLFLTVYNYRQAREIRGLRQLVERAVVMQERAQREARAREISFDGPAALEWLSRVLVGKPLTEVVEVYPNLRAVEVRGPGGRVLVTATPPKVLRRAFQAAKGKGVAKRLAAFARNPFLNPTQVREAGAGEGLEWFDLEAAAAGRALGVDWGEPARLWALLSK